MRHIFYSVLILCGTTLLFSNCIREEAESVECDITGVQSQWLKEHDDIVLGRPQIKQSQPSEVTFFMFKDTVAVKRLHPVFNLSAGAKLFYKKIKDEAHPNDYELVPDTAAYYDFTTPQYFCVRSENGDFIKEYAVSFTVPMPIDSCTFEHFTYDNVSSPNYMVPQIEQENGVLNSKIWTTGNGGFYMAPVKKTIYTYPTTFVEDPLTKKVAARMVTTDCGSMSAFFGKGIAAGNLFIGEFNATQAMTNPLGSTHFGLQVVKGEPLELTLSYRYEPNEKVVNGRQRELKGVVDSADVYAVLYEVDPKNVETLDGSNILSSDRIVKIARFPYLPPTKEWKRVSVKFDNVKGKTFDKQRWKRRGYAYTVVMTSSKKGANFVGAIGSELWCNFIKTTWKK